MGTDTLAGTDHGRARRRRRTAAGIAAAAGLAAAGLWPAGAASTPADRGPIAYDSLNLIATIGEAGGAPTTLAPGSGLEWSPDGTRIAYFTGSPLGPFTGISVANRNGLGVREVLRVQPGGIVSGVSPDGQPIGVITNFDLNGVTDPERLSGLSWAPDGQAVQAALNLGRSTLLVRIDLATGAASNLGGIRHPRGAIPRDITWSAAGRLVAFSARVTKPSDPGCTGFESRVYTYRLGGEAIRRVAPRTGLCFGTSTSHSNPAFSPEGTRLLVTRFRAGTSPATSRFDLQTIDVGPRGRALTDPRPTAPGLRDVIEATFAPDGQQIAYVFFRPGPAPVQGIGVVRADGTEAHDILTGSSIPPRRIAWGYAPRA